jgi:hypothetical protein
MKATVLADGRAFDAIAEERVAGIAPNKPTPEPRRLGAKSQP